MYLKNISTIHIFRLIVKYNIYFLTDQGCFDLIKKEDGVKTCICDEKENGMLLTMSKFFSKNSFSLLIKSFFKVP